MSRFRNDLRTLPRMGAPQQSRASSVVEWEAVALDGASLWLGQEARAQRVLRERVSKALGGLLRQLCKQLCSVRVYASPAENDVQAQRQVQRWRVSTNALLKGAPWSTTRHVANGDTQVTAAGAPAAE